MILTSGQDRPGRPGEAPTLGAGRTYLPIEQRRALLVDAALRVMVKHGVEAATTRAIAKEAGVPLGLLHYCYSNKDDLLADAYMHITDRVAALAMRDGDDVDDVLARYERGGAEALSVLIGMAIDLYWGVIDEDVRTEYACMELERHLAAAGRTDLVVSLVEKSTTSLAQTLERFAAVTGMRWTQPVDVIAASAHSALDGALRRRVSTGDVERHRQTLDVFGEVLGCLAEPVASTA